MADDKDEKTVVKILKNEVKELKMRNISMAEQIYENNERIKEYELSISILEKK